MLDGKKSILVINGPNLNLLGIREPHSTSLLSFQNGLLLIGQVYGPETLGDVEAAGKKQAEAAGGHIDFFQRYCRASSDGFV